MKLRVIGETDVYHGDCLDVMSTMATLGLQVDSVVTDPPYHLSTVKRFGKDGAAPANYGTDGLYQRASRGFMGKEWDGGDIAFNPETWRRCYDLLKPGGYLLAFSGSRTYHRIACAIEDAGFEIRDQIMWLYGTGFPKSHDVSKAIDKAARGVPHGGADPTSPNHGKFKTFTTEGKRSDADAGQGYGAGPGQFMREAGTRNEREICDAARQWQGWGTALKPAHEPIVMARKPLDGTVAANVLEHGTGALNIDACRVGTDTVGWGGTAGFKHTHEASKYGGTGEGEPRPVTGRFPANVLHDGSDEVLEAFAAYGESKSSDRARVNSRTIGGQGIYQGGAACVTGGHNDSGTAARFFYCAKASRKDRAGSKHPTVKPVSLIEYLCKLATRPGGTVLDPFAGSGTLGSAWPRSILIEREDEYIEDIYRRLSE